MVSAASGVRMSNGMVFLLHEAEDQKYAAALASQLGPHTVVATPFSERGMSFGLGAACVLLWRGSSRQAEAFVEATASSALRTVVTLGADTVPSSLRGNATILRGSGRAELDVVELGQAIARMHSSQDERLAMNARRSHGVRMGAASAGSSSPFNSGSPTMVRSAVGMTATLAMVGAGAWVITGREAAQATSPTPTPQANQASALNTANVSAMPVAPLAMSAAPAEIDTVSYEPDDVARPTVVLPPADEPFRAFKAFVTMSLLDSPEPALATLEPIRRIGEENLESSAGLALLDDWPKG